MKVNLKPLDDRVVVEPMEAEGLLKKLDRRVERIAEDLDPPGLGKGRSQRLDRLRDLVEGRGDHRHA